MTRLTSEDLLQKAKSEIKYIDAKEAIGLLDHPAYLFLDVREKHEVEQGRIPKSVHAARGSLEFSLDPKSGMAIDEAVNANKMILICGSGGRATLATWLARQMGYDAVCLSGGMKAWRAAGGAEE